MRGISTVVDVTVFLLLVGGAVATLVAGTGAIPSDGGSPTDATNPAAEDARVLATSTATVNYSLASATRSSSSGVDCRRASGSRFQRRAHGTLASLLADVVVGNATLEGSQVTQAGSDFERVLASTVRDRLGRPAVDTSVVAVWEPYPDAAVRGHTRVGDEPPRDADVHAATLRVDSAIPPSEKPALRAAQEEGYGGVAGVVASAVVRGLFPPNETRLALRGDYPVDSLTVHRYRRMACVLDADPPGVGDVGVSESNDRLATVLANRLERDLSDRYESPAAAARDVDTDTVHVTVRTWSP